MLQHGRLSCCHRAGNAVPRRGAAPGAAVARRCWLAAGARRAPLSPRHSPPKAGFARSSCVCCWPQQGGPVHPTWDTGWFFLRGSDPSPGPAHPSLAAPRIWGSRGFPRQIRNSQHCMTRTATGSLPPSCERWGSEATLAGSGRGCKELSPRRLQPSAAGGRKLPRRWRAKKRQGSEQPRAASYLF